MSYVVSIIRYSEADPSVASVISKCEWQAVIDADESLEPDSSAGAAGLVAQWVAHPNAREVWYAYQDDGSISTTSPDDATLNKTIAIAHTLSARVLGEEGEFLDATSITT